MDKFREECNNYNEVIDLVDKLVQLVDTSKEKEALELRDKIYEIFTKEYSEPIWNYLNLEEEIGFSLEKLNETDYIYADLEDELRKYKIIGINFKEKKIWFWDSLDSDYPVYLRFEDYKTLFWFKEDRSE